jgi:hypothetical protein
MEEHIRDRIKWSAPLILALGNLVTEPLLLSFHDDGEYIDFFNVVPDRIIVQLTNALVWWWEETKICPLHPFPLGPGTKGIFFANNTVRMRCTTYLCMLLFSCTLCPVRQMHSTVFGGLVRGAHHIYKGIVRGLTTLEER